MLWIDWEEDMNFFFLWIAGLKALTIEKSKERKGKNLKQ